MGGFLGLRVEALPLRLGHWLVSNFNPAQMAIKLSNGRFLRITEEGVAAVLDLPNGSVTMTERDCHMVGPDLLAWRCKVKKRNGNITVHALATLALSLKEGGVWFKRHFCLVVASTLVASTPNGYANQKTVHMFKDVRMIKDLDWCGYLLSSLVNTHDSWSQNTARKFTGPLLFLTLLYVDRVEVGERNVPRANPASHGWTKRALDAWEQQEVDAGGFGYGRLEEPFWTPAARPARRSSVEQTRYGRADSRPQPVHQDHTPGVSMISAASRAPTVPSSIGDTTGSRGATGDHPVHHGLIPATDKGFGCELDSMIADLRIVASRVANKVREDPRQAQGRQCFHHLGGVASLISGLIPTPAEVTTAPEHHEDPFWHSSQLFREVNRVEEAVTRDLATQRVVGMPVGQANGTMQSRQGVQVREPSPEGVEPPSFSLGMTQELAEVAPNRIPEVTTAPVLPPEHHEDPFWHSSQLFREVNRVEEAVTRDLTTQRMVGMPVGQANGTMQSRQGVQVREPSPEGFEPPSFSLGMTQELASQRVEDMSVGSLNARETRPEMEGLTAGPSNAATPLMQRQRTGGTITPQRGLRTLASLRVERRTHGLSNATTLTPQVHRPAVLESPPPRVPLGGRPGAVHKGKSPLGNESEPFCMVFNAAKGYPTAPLPPVYVVWKWLFDSPHGDRNEVLFQHADRKARWADFSTLKEGSNISKVMVDAWCFVLNTRENYRKPGVSSRMFLTPATTIGTVVAATCNRNDRLAWFTRRLDIEVQATDHVGIATLDMYIFPIMHNRRFFMISISFKHGTFDIIDSAPAVSDSIEIYGRIPGELRDLLAAYLERKQQPVRALRLRDMQPKRMMVAWGEPTAGVESAVYTMRHMEEYVGQKSTTWYCGLQAGGAALMLNLRKRFLHNIILSAANVHVQNIIARVGEYDRMRAAQMLQSTARQPS
ncbi:PREDICTED: uncharacterized protein LOC109157732 isoform X2 [Ipomoea nil]|uniref:uncharacterized protein LOC109157732 isoform X2 n=1 Tax=Ipomoea nil TaxID=35883 RepID=UPI0009018FBC|nr:PREDICTED: uncharacterized protein LOC109157732 isoform X2 [Ipomoea nil]